MLCSWEKFSVTSWSHCMSNGKTTKTAGWILISKLDTPHWAGSHWSHTHQLLLQLMHMIPHRTLMQLSSWTTIYMTYGFCLVDSPILSQSLNHLSLPLVSSAFHLPIQDFPVHSLNPMRKHEPVNIPTYHPNHHTLAPKFCLGQSQHLQPFFRVRSPESLVLLTLFNTCGSITAYKSR